MIHKVTPLLFLISLWLSFSASGQADYREGYVLTLKNDTIPGLVKYQNKLASSSESFFKATPSSTPITYSPEQINGYGFKDGGHYVSNVYVGHVTPAPVFMKFLVGGRINLYYYETKEKQREYYVVTKDTAKIELHNLRDTVYYKNSSLRVKGYSNHHLYRKQLKELMADKPELAPEIEKVGHNLDHLTNLVTTYNKAFAYVYIPDNESIQPHRFRFGLLAATGFTHLHLSNYAFQPNHQGLRYANFNKNSFYAIGAVVNFQPRELHERISFVLEPSIAVYTYGSDVLNQSGTSNSTHNMIDIDLLALKLPVSVKYSFYASRWKAIPFLRLGASYQKFLKSEANMRYTVTDSRNTTSGNYTTFKFSSYQSNVFLGVGSDFRLKKNIVSVEAILEGGDGIHVEKYQPFLANSWTRSWLVQLSFMFN